MIDGRAARMVAAVAGVVLASCLTTSCTNPANDVVAAPSGVRSIVDGRGEPVSVPRDLSRVLVLSEPTLDAVLALGVEPVGAAAARGQAASVPAYLEDLADDVPVVGPLGAPDLEQVLDLDPDVILIDGTAIADQAIVSRLEGIAPTVWTGGAGNSEWRTSFLLVADVLGRDAEAEQRLADYDEAVTAVAGDLADPDETVSIVRWGLASGSFLPPDTFPGSVVADLGLPRPAAQQGSGSRHSTPVSAENVSDLDADWMFFSTLGGAATPASAGDGGGEVGVAASADVLRTALGLGTGLEDLRVTRADHVVTVDGSVWGSAGGVLAALALVADVGSSLPRS